MANFCSYPKQERISEITLPNSMESNKSVTIGLWGFLDFDGKELQILAPPYISVHKGEIKGLVRLYELSSYHPGKWTIEAITESGARWDKLTVYVRPRRRDLFPYAVNGKYTDNPNEVPARTTTPTAREVVSMLLLAWPGLSENAARTLTAQFMGETGGGASCFNWNLGNVKAGPNEPHMYLRDIWECTSSPEADVARSNNLAYIPDADEARERGWKCPSGIVVYEPPHYQCRFKAYGTLREGAQRWISRHQSIAQRDPNYLPALNAGDIPAVAHSLKLVKYYTASEVDYARVMNVWKTRIDATL
jgi:hypothetical protein